MKLICPFCDTKYSATTNGRQVECACCSRVWTPDSDRTLRKFIIALFAFCFLLFAFVVGAMLFVGKKRALSSSAPLTVQVVSVSQNDENVLILRGAITNHSDRVYGVPKVAVVMRDAKGHVLGRYSFSPEVPLLAPSEQAEFSHRLNASLSGVKKVSLEFEKDVE